MLVRRFSDATVTELHRLRPHILMDAGELGSRNVSVCWLEVPAGASEVDGGAAEDFVANDGTEPLALVSVQSPPVSADELFSRRLAAQASGYDDYEDE